MAKTGAHTGLKSLIYYALKRCKGSGFHQHLAWMKRHQWENFETLDLLRQERLADLLRESHQWVPAYRQRLDEAEALYRGSLNLENWDNIPVLSRQSLIENQKAFTHRQAEHQRVCRIKTGGSTGTPVSIVQDYTFRDWSQASTALFYEWSDLSLGTPYFLLWAAYQDLHDQMTTVKDRFLQGYLQGRRILNCRVTCPDLMATFIQTINSQSDCHYLAGYANELYALACYSQENDLPITRAMKAVYATAANLTPAMRKTIETVFDCKVFNRYGCRDAGDLACECQFQQGLHINPMVCKIEIVDADGKPVPYGTEGEIVVTSLHNRAMPLIRYAVGDRGILNPPTLCACGREWETLVKLCGRTNEVLHLRDGKRFGGGVLYTAFEHLPHLKAYQIIQHSPEILEVRVASTVQNYTIAFADALKRLQQDLCDWAGYALELRFEQTDQFERTPTGKELRIIHRFEPGKEATQKDAFSLFQAEPVSSR